jgi:hypothetical protein
VAPRSLGPIPALAYVVCSMMNAKIRKTPEVFVSSHVGTGMTGSTLINTDRVTLHDEELWSSDSPLRETTCVAHIKSYKTRLFYFFATVILRAYSLESYVNVK